jgi:hypothetical protein
VAWNHEKKKKNIGGFFRNKLMLHFSRKLEAEKEKLN